MADDRDTPLNDAIDMMASAGTSEERLARAHRFRSPLVDAFSVALATINDEARAADPQVERHLSDLDATAAASGVMTSAVPSEARWWTSLPGPAVAQDGDRAEAILPRGGGALAVEGGSRARVRVGREGPAGQAVVITGPLPAGASWRSLVWWSVGRRRSQVVAMVALSLLAGLVGLLLPLATAALFGYAVPNGSTSMAAAILVAFALGSAGGALLILARNIIIIRLRDASDARMSPGIMSHLLRLPMSFFRRTSSGDTLNRALTVQTAREVVDDGALALVLTSAFGLVNLVFLFAIDVSLGIAMTLAIAVIVVIVAIAQHRFRRLHQRLLQERSNADAHLMSLIEAIVPVRVSGAESRALASWTSRAAPAISTLSRRMAANDFSQPVLVAAPIAINVVLILAVVGEGVAFTAAAFMSAYVAVVQLTIAMGLLTQNLWLLNEIGPTLERMVPITSTPVERPGPTRAPGSLQGRIQLTDIVFGYDPDQPPLLDGVSISVEPGEFVAVVGPSGSGKTTVMRLILGFETPWSGVVSYDGQDLADLDVAAVRRQMGTVLQASMPFGSTYRECICGPLQMDDDHLWRVIAESGLENEVRERGLDAPIGDRGGGISGGQRQRLMIARALVSDPRVILLDEATSALDNLTQDIVMRSILGRPVTRIAIAHRLTTVERADRILVVSAGRVVEEGTPSELLASGGHFARLAARQEF